LGEKAARDHQTFMKSEGAELYRPTLRENQLLYR